MRDYDARTVFTAIGICWIILGFILLTFIPAVIANMMFATDDVFIWLFPKWTYFVYGLGVVLIGFAGLTIGLIGIKTPTIIISIALFLLSIPVLFFAQKSHETIGIDGFEFQRPFTFEKINYTWNDVNTVNRYDVEDGDDFSGYRIYFNDGTEYVLKDDSRIRNGHQAFLTMVRNSGIEINYNP